MIRVILPGKIQKVASQERDVGHRGSGEPTTGTTVCSSDTPLFILLMGDVFLALGLGRFIFGIPFNGSFLGRSHRLKLCQLFFTIFHGLILS